MVGNVLAALEPNNQWANERGKEERKAGKAERVLFIDKFSSIRSVQFSPSLSILCITLLILFTGLLNFPLSCGLAALAFSLAAS